MGDIYSPDEERQRRSREYAALSRRLFFAELALGVAALLFLLFTGLSAWLRNLYSFPLPAQVAAYFLTVAVGYSLVASPMTYYAGFVLPHRYGLSHQSLGSWLWDLAKGGLVGLGLGSLAMVAVYWFLAAFPEIWWLLAAAFLISFSVVLSHLAPILITPLFYKQKPLDDAELSRRLVSLARRAGTEVRGAFVLDFSRKVTEANAALMGLANTRRIVLSDTLLGEYSADEIEVIVAHELGHHVHRDIPRLILFQSVTILASFYLAGLVLKMAVPFFGFGGIADVAAFPLFVLVVAGFNLAIRPLDNAYSQGIESLADRFALRLTENPRAFISMITKLTDQNLSEAEPSRWVEIFFYSHPPYGKRVALARHYADAQRQ
ncbi:MAG: M48 family metallopeptidase [Chloroflexi bacterium]|nr:M48 family metallopeptidase [Chloroflexota bacterium]